MSDAVLGQFKQPEKEKVISSEGRKFRVGIIGTGWIAESHIESYMNQPDVEIVAAADIIPGKARAKLDHYGLSESYFDETSGICDLMLLDVQSWTKYQIVYYRATDEISWPRMMPKGVAKDLMQDRLLIQKYELVLGKGKKKAKDGVESIEKEKRPPRSARRKKPKPPPLHKEPELTPEQKADIEDALKNAREANEAYENNRKKPSLAQTSDFRQMDELKRRGMSGDEIASRFGIDRVREYNAAHPKSPIKTSKHSKPGAPGFVW